MREILAVADLIPGDVILPEGWEVVGYPHGVKGLPGTIVTVDKFNDGLNVFIGHYYGNSETQVQVLRA